MYIRKTVDEYHIQSNYGNGWNTETIEGTQKEAIKQLLCYKKNLDCDLRIVKKRIKKEESL